MVDSNTEGPNQSSRLSRRDFLKGVVGVTVGGATLAYGGWRLGLESETRLEPSVRVLDFFELDKVKSKFLQDNFPSGFTEDNIWQEMGISNNSTREGLMKAVPKDENQTKLLMLALFINQYKDHGNNVVSVMDKTARFLHPSQVASSPAHNSIANAVEFGRLEYDEIGNPTIYFGLSKEEVDGLVTQTNESVVNMSFELGEFSLTYSLYDKKLKYPEMGRQSPSKSTVGEYTTYTDYQGNKITEEEYNEIITKMNEAETVLLEPRDRDVEFVDGYAGKITFQNLSDLAEIARKNPTKIFMAAGGNPTYLNGLIIPDIREARAKLERGGLWPENLIIVGFQAHESGFVGQASYGADIYVSDEDLKELGFSGASSYATPVVTEIVQNMISQGINTHKQVKTELLKLTQPIESSEGVGKTVYRLLDLNKAKATLSDVQGVSK